MLSKDIRVMRKQAKASAVAFKNVLKLIDSHLKSECPKRIGLASSFYHVLGYHMQDGDLRPEHLMLTSLLRNMNHDLD